MDFTLIKNYIRQSGDKFIVIENGEPELVIMSFVEYEKLARLQLPDHREAVAAQTRSRMNEPVMHRTDEDMIHETEFLAPAEIAPVRSAPVSGYGQIMERAREESVRTADIRLEDLPI